jgi:hypothetical protein
MSDETRNQELVASATGLPRWPWFEPANAAAEYWVDAWQRSILLLDVLRQRGNNSRELNARKAPNVLSFDAELVLDGRSLPRSVNYGLVRIVPPKGTSTDQNKRPFVVFDFATAPICSNYRGPHRQWPVALKSEPIEKTQ